MKKLIFISILSVTMFLGAQSIFASNAPNPPSGHGGTTNQSAPLGGGLILLLSMGGLYGGVKGYKKLKPEKDS